MIDKINQIFSESIDSIAKCASESSPIIANVAKMIVNALINERKILVCGHGTGASDAQDFAMKLIHRYNIERPSLPAISLNDNSPLITGIALDNDYTEVFSKQINALGQADDLLFVFAGHKKSLSLSHAIKTAHSREMQIIILCSANLNELHSILLPDDIELVISETSEAKLHQTQRIILHCLCELIDEELFGISYGV